MDSEDRKQVGSDLTTGRVLPLLLRFVVPLLLANLIQQLYNSVDTMVIGLVEGSAGTAGVSNGGEVITMLTFTATSFGSAAQIYVSQLAGAGNRKAVSETIGTMLTLMFLMSVVFTVLSICLSSPVLIWLNCPPEAFSEALSYMRIASFGLPFIFGYNALAGIMRGMGESKRPLIFIAVAATANVFLDLLLVVVFPLASAGTAIATACSEAAAFLAAAIFLCKRRKQFSFEISLDNFRMRKEHLSVILRLGIPLSTQSAFIHLTQIICTAQINTFGLVASATNSIGNKIQRLITVFITSTSSGAGAMVGQNVGAGKLERVRTIVYTTLCCTAIPGAIGAFICLFLPRQAFRLFTADQAVIELGVAYLRVTIALMVLSPVQSSYMSVLTGTGNAKLSFLAGTLDGVVLRLGFSFILAYSCGMGVLGFFMGNVLARLGPVAVSMIYYYSGKWKAFRLLPGSS